MPVETVEILDTERVLFIQASILIDNRITHGFILGIEPPEYYFMSCNDPKLSKLVSHDTVITLRMKRLLIPCTWTHSGQAWNTPWFTTLRDAIFT